MTGFGRESDAKKNQHGQKFRTINDNFIEKAIDYHIRGDLENAEKAYRMIIDHGSSDASIHSNLGVICQATLHP